MPALSSGRHVQRFGARRRKPIRERFGRLQGRFGREERRRRVLRPSVRGVMRCLVDGASLSGTQNCATRFALSIKSANRAEHAADTAGQSMLRRGQHCSRRYASSTLDSRQRRLPSGHFQLRLLISTLNIRTHVMGAVYWMHRVEWHPTYRAGLSIEQHRQLARAPWNLGLLAQAKTEFISPVTTIASFSRECHVNTCTRKAPRFNAESSQLCSQSKPYRNCVRWRH